MESTSVKRKQRWNVIDKTVKSLANYDSEAVVMLLYSNLDEISWVSTTFFMLRSLFMDCNEFGFDSQFRKFVLVCLVESLCVTALAVILKRLIQLLNQLARFNQLIFGVWCLNSIWQRWARCEVKFVYCFCFIIILIAAFTLQTHLFISFDVVNDFHQLNKFAQLRCLLLGVGNKFSSSKGNSIKF